MATTSNSLCQITLAKSKTANWIGTGHRCSFAWLMHTSLTSYNRNFSAKNMVKRFICPFELLCSEHVCSDWSETFNVSDIVDCILSISTHTYTVHGSITFKDPLMNAKGQMRSLLNGFSCWFFAHIYNSMVLPWISTLIHSILIQPFFFSPHSNAYTAIVCILNVSKQPFCRDSWRDFRSGYSLQFLPHFYYTNNSFCIFVA